MNLLITRPLRGFAAAMLLTAAQLAQAHAHLKTAVPAEGAHVVAPKDVTLVFDDTLEPAFSSIQVTDAAGKPVIDGQSAVGSTDKKHMSVKLHALEPGTYQVKWVAVAADGHRTENSYTFAVKQ